jgi:hypothetical protein
MYFATVACVRWVLRLTPFMAASRSRTRRIAPYVEGARIGGT